MNENQNIPSGETRDFDPVNKQGEAPSGATKQFDKVNPDVASRKDKKDKKQKEEKQDGVSKKIAKNTAKGTAYVVKKILTWTLTILFTVLLVGIITGAVVGIAFITYIKNYVDPTFNALDNLQMDSALSTTMYYLDENGDEILLADDTLEGSENRLWAEYQDIPKMLINAYIAVEDQRFLEHEGVDTTRTASAIYNFFIPTSANYGGGSTITQQLIKNVSGENEATIQRKVQEIFRAYYVEERYTKDQIMEMYLNTIYLSHNSYGVRVAAQTYFGKELSELNLAECAAIASIGKSPTKYDPILNPQNNLERRNLVLKLMLEQEFISKEEFDQYYDAPITLAKDSDEEYVETVHSYYIDTVMEDVIADLMAKYECDRVSASRMLFSGGLQIVTCMDPVIQDLAEKVYTDKSYWPDNSGMQAQSAICIMDPETGNLLAIVGGLGEKKESRGFNRATDAFRQCGSSIKPISVYALAIENGLYSGGASVDDVPWLYDKEEKLHWPSNAGRSYLGRVSLDYAIQASLNTIAVSTCDTLGVENVFQNLVRSGYTTLVDSETRPNGTIVSDKGLSPMALGGLTYGVTVRDHTQAYATLANGGITSKARTYSVVRDSSGRVILDNREEHEEQYSENTAAILTDLLTHVVTGSSGTARRVISLDDDFGLQVAAKTGTTNDNIDVYFSGYTPDFVACTWYGYDLGKTISDSTAAAKLWNAVFNEIYEYYEANGISYQKEFKLPATIVTDVEYCTVSGKLATDACRNDLYDMQGGSGCVAYGAFIRGTEPTEECDRHVMVKWDQVTGGICLDGCTCPESNIIEVGFRLMTLEERCLEGRAYIADAQFCYMPLPEGVALNTNTKYPFFYNAFPEDFSYAFGAYRSSVRPANSICAEHYVAPTVPPVNPPVIPPVTPPTDTSTPVTPPAGTSTPVTP